MEKVTRQTIEMPNNKTSVDLINVNGQIVAFCQTNDFEKYVKKVINDELFWRDLFQTFNIKPLVQNELNDKVPTLVKNEANKVIKELTKDMNKLVKDQLDNYTQFQIPSHVSKALADQITGFLNNNTQMNQILIQQSNALNQQLYNSATDILTKLVNEEQYHQLTNLHISAINSKCDEALKNQQGDANRQLSSQDRTFNLKLNQMQQQVSSELVTITQANEQIKEQKSKLEKQQSKLEKMEKTVSSLTFTINILGLGLAIVTGVGFYLFKR